MKSYNQFTAEAYSSKENIQEAIPLALMGAAKLASMGLSAYSAYSAAQNLRKGKYGDAALDALGMVPGGVAFKGAKALGAGRNLARGASATQSVVRNFSPNARNRAIEGGIDMATKAVLGTGAATASQKDPSKTQPAAPASSSTPPTPKSSSVVLARKGGVMGKLDKSTGKWTKGDWTDKESARYKRVSAAMGKSPAPKQTPAAVAGVTPASSKKEEPAPKMTGVVTPVKKSLPSLEKRTSADSLGSSLEKFADKTIKPAVQEYGRKKGEEKAGPLKNIPIIGGGIKDAAGRAGAREAGKTYETTKEKLKKGNLPGAINTVSGALGK